MLKAKINTTNNKRIDEAKREVLKDNKIWQFSIKIPYKYKKKLKAHLTAKDMTIAAWLIKSIEEIKH